MLYVRKRTMTTIPRFRRWYRFATKLQLAARLVEWIVPILKKAGKTVGIVVDGGYTKRPFLRRVLRLSNVVIVGRLRKDAALRDLPPKLKKGQRRSRARPRKYGKNRVSLAKRAGQKRGWQSIDCTVYGETTTKTYKTFLATYVPVGGFVRVVLVKEEHGWYAFFCTDPNASVQEILEAFADRATIEQGFHDVKEVWGLPPDVDLVFVCDVLTHVKNRGAWLKKLHEQMEPGSRLVLIDFKEGELPEGPPESIKVPQARILQLCKDAGFHSLVERDDLLPYQQFLAFRRL